MKVELPFRVDKKKKTIESRVRRGGKGAFEAREFKETRPHSSLKEAFSTLDSTI